jgi:hypothetical protein
MQMRFSGLIAILSSPLLCGFAPINTFEEAMAVAREACGKLVGKNIRSDLFWFGVSPGPLLKAHWIFTAIKQGDYGPNPHWFFRVDLPPSGAGPNICIKNDGLPASELVAPEPPTPKPRPVAPKHPA